MKKLSSLLAALSTSALLTPLSHGADVDVVDVSTDSRLIQPGMIFVAIVGTNFDGHAAIGDAIARGASAIVVEHQPPSPLPVPVICVSDSRRAFAELVRVLFDHPSEPLAMYGVTGTNGKTTCATLLEQVLTLEGRSVGFIGTTGNRFAGAEHATEYSTPHARQLAELFLTMRSSGVDAVCMEVSSHALSQHRVLGIDYRGAIFTNLTRDHLDYHGTMQEYARCKKLLFDGLSSDATAVLWGDSEWTPYMKRGCSARHVITVGQGADNHVRVTHVALTLTGTTFTLERLRSDIPNVPDRCVIHTRLLGEFNVANCALVAVLCMVDGMSPDRVQAHMHQVAGPKGRMEVHAVPGGPTAIVDYAHTPDALESVLRVIRSLGGDGGKVHVVFGCGGDRDRGKRSEMGRIASELADHVVITNDNPRTESPSDIIAHIMGGIDGPHRHRVRIIEDRRAAIHSALDAAAPSDVVLIAGKGHEEYQIIGAERLPFSDAEEVRKRST
ncbi:MAG: UDP-N-acetylmuramoyl-L-alanyl-D-glutamate--2,6-diaminopimelate ligase [Bacteroidota bacterium]